MNKVILCGRLTKDTEIKLTTNQTKFCQFTLAVDRKFKDQNGQKQTDFISCIAWRNTADFIAKYFKKGNKIGICGSIQTRSYEKDGQKTFITEVVVEEAEFVENNAKPNADAEVAPIENSSETSQQENTNTEQPGELPFEI